MNEFFTSKQACEFLGIKQGTLYKLTSNREINFYKPNWKKMYFSKTDLIEYLTRNKYEKIGA